MNDKNLLIISPHYWTFVKDQVEELSNYFNHIYVIVVHPYIPKLKKLSIKNKHFADLDKLPKNVIVIEKNYFYVPFGPLVKLRGKLAYRSAKRVIKEKRLRFDIIHAHFLWPCGFVAMKLHEEFRIPYVLTGHGYDVYDLPFQNSFYNKLIPEIIKKSERLITVSQRNSHILTKKLKIPKEKIIVIPNGFDERKFKPRKINKKELKIEDKRKVILSIGNLEKIKGHYYLIEAMRLLTKTRNDIHCIIIGGGEEYTKLRTLIQRYRLDDTITLKGPIPHELIPLWMNACDIYVQPSLNEGVPTVIFEALACGKPVIGTKVGGIPEIINKKNGILVDPKDSKQLAIVLEKGLKQKWNTDYIINYSKQFTWEKIANQIMEVYCEVLDTK